MMTCSKPCAHRTLQAEISNRQVAIRCSHCGATIGESLGLDGYVNLASGARVAPFKLMALR